MKLVFKVEKMGDYFHSWCPELKECHSHGRTIEEALDNLDEAVDLYLDVTEFSDTIHIIFEVVEGITELDQALYHDKPKETEDE